MEHDPAEAKKLFTFEALEASYRECRRRKRSTLNALRFECDLERNLSELAAYRSILARADTWRLRRSLWARFPYLERLYAPPSLKPFWRGGGSFPCFAAQAHAYRERFQGSLVLLDVGRFLEVHGREAEALGRLVKLKVYRGRRGGAWRWTRFPVERLDWVRERAHEARIETIVLVAEEREEAGRVLPRRAVACGIREPERSEGPAFAV